MRQDPRVSSLSFFLCLPPIDLPLGPSRFIVFDYAKRYKEADGTPLPFRLVDQSLTDLPTIYSTAELASFVNSGQLKIREHRLTGIENCVEGLLGLFEGVNTGKIVIKIGSGETKL